MNSDFSFDFAFLVQVDSISKHSFEIKVRMNAIHNCHNPFSKSSLTVTAANGSLHSFNFSLLLIFVPLTVLTRLQSQRPSKPWGKVPDLRVLGQWMLKRQDRVNLWKQPSQDSSGHVAGQLCSLWDAGWVTVTHMEVLHSLGFYGRKALMPERLSGF